MDNTRADVPISERLDLEQADFWLDFQRPEASWESLCRRLDNPLVPLVKVHASPDLGQMQVACTEAMAAQVAQRFVRDFEYLSIHSPDSRKPEGLGP